MSVRLKIISNRIERFAKFPIDSDNFLLKEHFSIIQFIRMNEIAHLFFSFIPFEGKG